MRGKCNPRDYILEGYRRLRLLSDTKSKSTTVEAIGRPVTISFLNCKERLPTEHLRKRSFVESERDTDNFLFITTQIIRNRFS